jgi:hypothetical protein
VASHREQQDADCADRQGQRGRKGKCICPVEPRHGTKWTWSPGYCLIWVKRRSADARPLHVASPCGHRHKCVITEKRPEVVFDSATNAHAQHIHHQLLNEGYEAYSPDYFARLEMRLDGEDDGSPTIDEQIAEAQALLRQSEERYHQAPDVEARRPVTKTNPAPPRQPIRVSAPPSRETPTASGYRGDNGQRITLNAAQKEAARISGVSEMEYAQNLLRLNEEKKNGSYGGQP